MFLSSQKAHCVYSHGNHAWSKVRFFAPARYRGRLGVTHEPYGRWRVEYMQAYETFVSSTDPRIISSGDPFKWSYDIAVIKLRPRFGKHIGDVLGHAGIKPTTASSPLLSEDYIRGYPYDKPNGQMWRSGPCTYSPCFWCDNIELVAEHNCDVVGAMSGTFSPSCVLHLQFAGKG